MPSFQTGQFTGVDTDLWLIRLWKEVCIFLIANEHNFLLFSECIEYIKYSIHPFITSVNLFWWRRAIPLGFSIGNLLCIYKSVHSSLCVCLFFSSVYLFIYFPPQNLQWARDVLLGSSVPWQQLKHMPAQGLFCERNKTNLFNVSHFTKPASFFMSPHIA